MKAIWAILLIFAVIICFGCAHKSNQVSPKEEIRNYAIQTSRMPDLLDGPEGSVRAPHPLTLADLRAKYKSTFLLSGPPTKREVALTFDDAPDDRFTPQVLDILKKEGVKVA